MGDSFLVGTTLAAEDVLGGHGGGVPGGREGGRRGLGGGDRAGLDHADGFAGPAVLVQDPFHVDRVAVVALDREDGADHGGDLLLVQDAAVDKAGRHGGLDHAAGGVVEGRDHLLGGDLVAQDTAVGLAD